MNMPIAIDYTQDSPSLQGKNWLLQRSWIPGWTLHDKPWGTWSHIPQPSDQSEQPTTEGETKHSYFFCIYSIFVLCVIEVYDKRGQFVRGLSTYLIILPKDGIIKYHHSTLYHTHRSTFRGEIGWGGAPIRNYKNDVHTGMPCFINTFGERVVTRWWSKSGWFSNNSGAWSFMVASSDSA